MVYQGIYGFLISLNCVLPWSLGFVPHTKQTIRTIPIHPCQHIKLEMAFRVSLSMTAAWYDIAFLSFQHKTIRSIPKHQTIFCTFLLMQLDIILLFSVCICVSSWVTLFAFSCGAWWYLSLVLAGLEAGRGYRNELWGPSEVSYQTTTSGRAINDF